MYYVYIDIANIDIIVSSAPFKISQLVLNTLDHSQQIKIGIETTDYNGKNLKSSLSSIKYSLVKQFVNLFSNRKPKSEEIDTSIIAKFLSM